MNPKEIIFLYDPPRKEWVRCEEPAFAGEIERLTPIVVAKRPEGAMVWCKKHRAYEEIETWQDDGLTTKAGCRMQGPKCEAPCLNERWHRPELINRHLRWRVSRQKDSGTIFIAADVAQIVWHVRQTEFWDRVISIPYVRGYTTEGISLRLSPVAEIPEKNCADIPSPVADAALELLLENAGQYFGVYPELPQGLHDDLFADGRTRLTAFLRYPFHMELFYMRPYFRTDTKQMDLWGHQMSDIFPQLCKRLAVAPSRELRAAYEKRPLALPISIMLRQHGVSRFDLAEPFFRLSTLFGEPLVCERGKDDLRIGDQLYRTETEYPKECFMDDEVARRLLEGRDSYLWGFKASRFYCHWRLCHEGEEALARHLLDLNEHWEPRLKKAIDTFFLYYTDLPKTLRDDILREGLTLENHNRMIAAANRVRLEAVYTYSPEAKDYECQIDGYSFRLMRSSGQIRSFMCRRNSGSAGDGILYKDDGSLRFGLYRDGAPVAMIMLRGSMRILYDGRRHQYEQSLAEAAIYIACLHWLKWTGLYRRYEPFPMEDYMYLDEDVKAEPLPPSHEAETVHDLLTLPETEIREGYYKLLHERLLDERPLVSVVSPEETGADEMAYLMRLFPYGERIYRAAFAGNREAQLVLSKCYDNGWHDTTLFMDEDEEKENIEGLLCGLQTSPNAFRKARGEYWKKRAAGVEREE